MAREEHPITPASGTQSQAVIDAHFGQTAAYWRDVYEHEGLQGLVYRERMQAALAWIDELRLPEGSRVLEVGCGAGLATVELARRGFQVEATDASADMVATASRRVDDEGLGEAVSLGVADVHSLGQPASSVALVLALGVLPWLHSPERAIQEIARVLAPDGHAVVSADNRLRLNGLVEPAESPLFVPFKYLWRVLSGRVDPRSRGAVSRLYTPRATRRMLVRAGLRPERERTLGFGPFTVRWRSVLSDRTGFAIHRRLSRLADRGVPGLRHTGWHYLVCARKVSR
jgi:ubiquinone/menaquinone biosynthesis C-methylase UbiE